MATSKKFLLSASAGAPTAADRRGAPDRGDNAARSRTLLGYSRDLFFRDAADGARDVIGLQVVMMGRRASEAARDWFAEAGY